MDAIKVYQTVEDDDGSWTHELTMDKGTKEEMIISARAEREKWPKPYPPVVIDPPLALKNKLKTGKQVRLADLRGTRQVGVDYDKLPQSNTPKPVVSVVPKLGGR